MYADSAFYALQKQQVKKRKLVDRRASKSRKIRFGSILLCLLAAREFFQLLNLLLGYRVLFSLLRDLSRYHVHEKITNFMAPVPMAVPPMAPKLFENLFGTTN